jgi:hypothetical protein
MAAIAGDHPTEGMPVEVPYYAAATEKDDWWRHSAATSHQFNRTCRTGEVKGFESSTQATRTHGGARQDLPGDHCRMDATCMLASSF